MGWEAPRCSRTALRVRAARGRPFSMFLCIALLALAPLRERRRPASQGGVESFLSAILTLATPTSHASRASFMSALH